MSESQRPYAPHRFSASTERRLEEIRQLLHEAEPIAEPSALERLDAATIEDRRMFKRRFGRDWPLRHHRSALIQLRRERDWTDGEIKLFLISGMLKRGPFGVRPEASAWLALFGYTLATLLALFATLLVLLFATRAGSLTLATTMRAGASVSLYLVFAWLAYQLYVRPWRIQRRTTLVGARVLVKGA